MGKWIISPTFIARLLLLYLKRSPVKFINEGLFELAISKGVI
jgi:hypothetical protein